MKTLSMIEILLLLWANGIQAQPAQNQLHQIELMKPVNEKTQLNTYQSLQDF